MPCDSKRWRLYLQALPVPCFFLVRLTYDNGGLRMVKHRKRVHFLCTAATQPNLVEGAASLALWPAQWCWLKAKLGSPALQMQGGRRGAFWACGLSLAGQ